MELDQEKLTRNESERSRELAQRIRRELGPCSVQVLGGVGALESALEAVGAVQPAEGALPELLVVVDPEWVTLPQQLADRVHVSSRTIISLEKELYNPSLLLAYRIAELFGVTVEDLYCLKENRELEDRQYEDLQ